jgi:hypothetical protein
MSHFNILYYFNLLHKYDDVPTVFTWEIASTNRLSKLHSSFCMLVHCGMEFFVNTTVP